MKKAMIIKKFLLLPLLAALLLTGCGQQDNSGKTAIPAPTPKEISSPAATPAPAPPAAESRAEDPAAKTPRPVTVLSPMPPMVAADTVEIKGKTRPGNRIYINGQEAPLSPNGEFSLPFSLQVGKNEIKVVTLGKEKTEDTQVLTVERQPVPPKLTVISPDISEAEAITISGQTERGCVVYVNTNLARPDREGNFSSTVTLKEGVNEIITTSTSRDGGIAKVTRKITFTPSNPRLEVIIPEDTRNKQVTISGITDAGTVLVLYVNDVKTNVNMQNGVFSGAITLEEGVNVVAVTAVNKWGRRTTVTKNIYYSIP